ncbi:MAG: hypothetical protein HN936_02730 [Bacteroidetes bacterium]|jgi:hypothetical protein|nr:hypothetical protein [Candidatus Neomarinimicrobiota bacterium]MBT4361884.1 hypothetical protein [Candidatus Neomarinimicrobiota bacterium]MBT6011501.1 hypothetical protein [Candidatus Neomarinimicrobiota bacterium]MBT7092132.1 hypothetical protein [Bacteroidota bacterium]MBT7617652.1 hypothetical protein [Calditrichota bacterium]
MNANWPQYFLTASFIQKFDAEFMAKTMAGLPMENLDLFRNFLMNAKGKIFRDVSRIRIGESPLLRSLLGNASNAGLSPYSSGKDSEGDTTDIQKSAYSQFDSSFTELFTENEIVKLNQSINQPIFNLSTIKKRWPKISGKENPSIVPGKMHDWSTFLGHYSVPTKNVLVCDSFLMSDARKVKENLIPILKAVMTLQAILPKVTIISSKSHKDDTVKQIEREVGEGLEIDFVVEESPRSVSFHDRWILFDQMLLNFPSGLDIVSKGVVHETKLTNPAVRSIFSGDDGQVQEVSELWKSMGEFIARRKSMRRVTSD